MRRHVDIASPYRHRASWAHSSALHAFTLIEVLVVIAIISLLLAILLPALDAARRQSRQILCQTNLRGIAQAWHGYLADSDGRFPKSDVHSDNEQINYGGKQGTGGRYYGADADFPVPKPLNKYLSLPLVTTTDAEVFKCPCDKGGNGIQPTCYDNRGTSYLMNHLLVGPKSLTPRKGDPCESVMAEMESTDNPPHQSRIECVNLNNLGSTSKVLLVGDYGWYNAWEYSIPFDRHMDWHYRPMFHNLVFSDGHVNFTQIRKGMHTTDHYTVMPFSDLQTAVHACQEEVLPPDK